MADVESLFGTSSLTQPKPPIALPHRAEPSAEALGTALLAGILTDLASLKEAVRHQGTINAAFGDFATAQQDINESLAQADRQQLEVNGHQADSNAAQNRCNAEVVELIERHNLFVERVTGLLGELDERLAAIDGKRSFAPELGEANGECGDRYVSSDQSIAEVWDAVARQESPMWLPPSRPRLRRSSPRT